MTTYLDVLADEIRREVPEDAMPEDDTNDLFRLYAVLLLAKGQAVDRKDVHNAWVAWMSARGEQHSSMRPFDELPDNTKAEDSPFVLAIRRVADRRSRG
jgi:hypothetical protein